MQTPQEFLIHEYTRRKALNANFSLRAFARWLKLSPAQVSQMMSGKRSITLSTLKKITVRLGLSPIEKRKLYNSVIKIQDNENSTKDKFLNLKEDQFVMISDWYHLAILSLIKMKGSKPDPRWISSRLGIRIDEASQALIRLERLGIIQTKPIFKQIGNPFEVSSTVPSVAIRKYHKQNLNLAAEKIDLVPINYREFQSLSVSMNPSKVKDFKIILDEFLETVSEMFDSELGSEVYHVNVQMFPVTRLKDQQNK
jgi:uncharacterized protein (TIGR02147 family)